MTLGILAKYTDNEKNECSKMYYFSENNYYYSFFLFLQIAPYWIQTPPTIVSLTVNQTLTLTAAALGTPAPNFHWYKDDEEIFIRSNLKIQTTSNGSQLIIEGKFIF